MNAGKPSETYAVLLEPSVEPDLQAIASAIAPATGEVKMDLVRQLKDRSGILAEGLTESQAGTAIMGLRQRGVPVFAVRQSQMAVLTEPVVVHEGKVRPEGFRFHGPSGNALARWSQIVFIDCARVRCEEMKERSEVVREVNPGPRGSMNVSWRTKRSKHQGSAWKELFDAVCCRPWAQLRFDSTSFRFADTGLPVHPSRHDNYAALVVVFKARCERAISGPGVERLLDGDPNTNLRTSSLRAYENHIRWQLQLLRRKPKQG